MHILVTTQLHRLAMHSKLRGYLRTRAVKKREICYLKLMLTRVDRHADWLAVLVSLRQSYSLALRVAAPLELFSGRSVAVLVKPRALHQLWANNIHLQSSIISFRYIRHFHCAIL